LGYELSLEIAIEYKIKLKKIDPKPRNTNISWGRFRMSEGVNAIPV
jgi:hypothetical protein